jgi:putative ABC transport system permease protein
MGFWGSYEIYKFMHWFLLAVQSFLSACGIMILAVGSIGVANMMFLIVTERTYEIGLRKAIGATDKQIFLQLLFEVLIIMTVGGGLGIGAAFFTITFLQHIITLPQWLGVPTLSWATGFMTIFILALIGLITGFFPARRAAKMDPIEALMT